MVVSIRLPSESHSPPPHYSYRHRSSVLSPRLWRRILPLALLFVLAVESYRLILAQSLSRASPRTPLAATPQPLPVPPAPPPHDDSMFDLGRPQLPPDMAHLVVVACHAIWKGGPTQGRNESEWVLEPFQRGTAAQDTFAAHIEAGVRAARQDPRALLVFSGGESRAGVGPRMEATSYFELAMARGWIAEASELLNRTTTELGALDSYQNLLFSLVRFRELTRRYPRRITLISYAFKRQRFEQLHRRAIRFPADRFAFVGIDPPAIAADKDDDDDGGGGGDGDQPRDQQQGPTSAREAVLAGERANALTVWTADPYACRPDSPLRAKRRARNAGRRYWAYRESVSTAAAAANMAEHRDGGDAAVVRLLTWCEAGGRNGEWFAQSLPWSEAEP